jgi:hypothetical protein
MRITTESRLKEEEFLISIKGVPCFPRSDLTAITGQAKSGKTMLISLLMATSIAPSTSEREAQQLPIARCRDMPLKVMWVDTEQSPVSTQQILRDRVEKMVGTKIPDSLLYAFNLRGVMVEDRFDLIVEGVMTYQPDIVIIDNIRDLVHDINDGVKSQQIIESLMKLATEQSCNITCVLHQNRSAENRGLRGWLGTELANKVFEVYSCMKLKQKHGVKPLFCVEQTDTRKYDIDEPLYYQVDDLGTPVAADMKGVQLRNTRGQYASKQSDIYRNVNADKLNRDYIIERPDRQELPWEWDLQRLCSDAMGGWEMRRPEDLEQRVKELSHIKMQPYCEKVINAAIDRGILTRSTDRFGKVVLMLARHG